MIKVVYKCCEQILGYGYPFTRKMAIILFSSFEIIVSHKNCLINIELLYYVCSLSASRLQKPLKMVLEPCKMVVLGIT
jgi:hypothetical protein